jgi:hypothetical protein
MPDLVLIDDDILIHAAWNVVAKAKGHDLLCVRSIPEFLDHQLPQSTLVYVDYHFQNGLDGMVESIQLYERGYKNLYIATGSKVSNHERPAHIIAIVGKDYPL